MFSADDGEQGFVSCFAGANSEFLFDSLFRLAGRIGLELLEIGERISECLLARGNRIVDHEVALVRSGCGAR